MRREGRFTPGQRRAFDRLWPRYGIDDNGKLDLNAIFGRHAPRTLEIGFGNGENLARLAAAEPEQDFLGIEVHRPGVGRLLQSIEEHELSNVRIVCHDAVEVLENPLADTCLDRVLILFPDPWHKKRHHKRRLIQPRFVELLARKIKPGGLLHIATDWQPYAEHCLAVLGQASAFSNTDPGGACAEKPAYRSLTRFERRGLKLGHQVCDLVYRRN